jgi:hypothetical protein
MEPTVDSLTQFVLQKWGESVNNPNNDSFIQLLALTTKQTANGFTCMQKNTDHSDAIVSVVPLSIQPENAKRGNFVCTKCFVRSLSDYVIQYMFTETHKPPLAPNELILPVKKAKQTTTTAEDTDENTRKESKKTKAST